MLALGDIVGLDTVKDFKTPCVICVNDFLGVPGYDFSQFDYVLYGHFMS